MTKIRCALVLFVLLFGGCVSFPQRAFSTPADGTNSSSSLHPAIIFAEKVSVHGVPNVGRISDQLYRGAQPHLPDLGELKKLGITTIIDLRSESSHTREEERRRAEELGMHFVSIPLGGFSNPSSAQLAQYFSLLRKSPSEKLFVHCRFGHDRTGVFIAAYRIAFQHWTANDALAEMNAFGFNHTWHPGMSLYVRDLPNRLQTDPLLKSSLLN